MCVESRRCKVSRTHHGSIKPFNRVQKEESVSMGVNKEDIPTRNRGRQEMDDLFILLGEEI